MSERPGHTNHLCTSGEFVAHQVPAGLDVDLDATIGEVDAGEVGATKTCCVTTSRLFKEAIFEQPNVAVSA